MLHRRGITLTTVLAVLLAAGCTSQDDPEPPPIVSSPSETAPEPSPTPSPTPTPTQAPVVAPEPPAELERIDEVGAAAAAEYFVSLYSYTMQSGDTANWLSMSSDVCGFCSRIASDAATMFANEEQYIGGEIALDDVTVLAKDDLLGGYPVDAHFVQAPVRHTANDGTVINETVGDSGPVRVDTLWTNNGWKILAVVVGEA
ncbi:DUF6318 family protein [Cellulomonas sp. ATA003]|uniref:DUF6318 family protein n=1 Tax=Cellulomonas sp. ATA003 TaxID=3073064 RepID=UPI002872CAE3|nr:DUF6318 family protein [Cellulomonas sp. ATA003]WNB87407.1 DUF6318 family protein [Cellulomonas sp. ATA003]